MLTGAFSKGSAGLYNINLTDTTALARGTYALVDFSSTSFVAGDFNQLGSLAYTVAGMSGSFMMNGTELDYVVVPEPGTWALLPGALGFLVFLRFRQNRLI